MSEFTSHLPEFFGNHMLLSLAFVGIAVALIGNEFSRLTRGFRGLSPAELTRMINRENALVVDVSAIGEFEKGHIPGSKHVAMSQFDPENKVLAKVRDLPIVVVCRSGNQAAIAARRLVKAGFGRVFILDGGVGAWQQAELPLTRGKA